MRFNPPPGVRTALILGAVAAVLLIAAEMRGAEQFSRADFTRMRAEAGRLNLTVTSVEATGTTADTVIEHNGAEPEDIAFSYENGGWKWCEF